MLALIKAEIRMNEDFLDIVISDFLRPKRISIPTSPVFPRGIQTAGSGPVRVVDPQAWCSRYTCVVKTRFHPPWPWVAVVAAVVATGGGTGSGILLAPPHLLREGGRSTGLLLTEDAIAEYNRLSNQRDPSLKPVLLFRPKDWGADDQLQPRRRMKATVQLLTKI